MVLVLIVSAGAITGLVLGATCALDPIHHCLIQLLALDAGGAEIVFTVFMIFVELPLFLIVGGLLAYYGYAGVLRARNRPGEKLPSGSAFRHFHPVYE